MPGVLLVWARTRAGVADEALLDGLDDDVVKQVLIGTGVFHYYSEQGGQANGYRMLKRLAGLPVMQELTPLERSEFWVRTAYFGTISGEDSEEWLWRAIDEQESWSTNVLKMACEIGVYTTDPSPRLLKHALAWGLEAKVQKADDPAEFCAISGALATLYETDSLRDEEQIGRCYEDGGYWVSAALSYLSNDRLDDAARCLQRVTKKCVRWRIASAKLLRLQGKPAEGLALLDAHPELLFQLSSYHPTPFRAQGEWLVNEKLDYDDDSRDGWVHAARYWLYKELEREEDAEV